MQQASSAVTTASQSAQPATKAQTTTYTRVAWWPVLVILLFAAAWFITDLQNPSLWSDEGWTIATTETANPVTIVGEWVAVDVHPPLFFLGLSVYRLFVGDTIFELRYYSVLLTMLGVAVAFQLGKSLFSTRAGLLAALFYTLHDLIYVLTHEVRHYPQQILLSTVVMWLYWRFWQQPSRNRSIPFAIAGAALLYTHYWGGFVLLALAIHALITRRRALRPFVLAFVAIGLLFIPWLPVLYNQITLERPGGLPHALPNTRFVYAVLTYQLIGIPELFWTVLATIGALGAFAARPMRWLPSAASLAPLLTVIIAPVLSVLFNLFYPTLSFRSLAVVIPAVIVLAAHGLSQFRPREQYALVVFILLFSISTTSATSIDRPDWPTIAEYITQHSDESDVVLFENDTDEHALMVYLDYTETGIDYAFSESQRERFPETYADYLTEALADKDGIWVSKLGWPALADIRPELNARGYVQSAPEREYGFYDDRPILLWRLDRIPEGDPITTFGPEMRLFRAEAAAHPENITVNMVWSPATVPAQDYVVSAFVRRDDGTFRNVDSQPLDGDSPTPTWAAEGVYFDSRVIPTEGLAPGSYQVGLQVYYFTDPIAGQFENIFSSDCSDDPDCRFIIVDTVTID